MLQQPANLDWYRTPYLEPVSILAILVVPDPNDVWISLADILVGSVGNNVYNLPNECEL